jgi:hypothetical protein
MIPAPGKDAVVGGLYLMWSGNPEMSLGELIETFLGVEGIELSEIGDEEWPQRAWKFCPWCGKTDLAACLDRSNPESCASKLWDDPD